MLVTHTLTFTCLPLTVAGVQGVLSPYLAVRQQPQPQERDQQGAFGKEGGFGCMGPLLSTPPHHAAFSSLFTFFFSFLFFFYPSSALCGEIDATPATLTPASALHMLQPSTARRLPGSDPVTQQGATAAPAQ